MKAINFMLGGSDQLPVIDERKGYESIWFGFTLAGVGDFTVQRSIEGGDYALFPGLVTDTSKAEAPRKLSAQHDAQTEDNLSNILLTSMGFEGKSIARNSHGAQANLSFRHLSRICSWWMRLQFKPRDLRSSMASAKM
jgi:hypothetical protein